MDGGELTPEMVMPLLNPADPVVRQAALWVIGHHGDWGPAMVGFLRPWLSRGNLDDASRDELKRQLLAFAKDPAVEQLVAEALTSESTPLATRLALLEVIGQAELPALPPVWTAPLRAALDDVREPVVSQAVATLRALPLDKRPLLTRIDRQINYPETNKRFAGTRLSENFCVRWSGILRSPQDADYTFFTESDDGSQLFIDGTLVVDNGGSHAMRERDGKIRLAGGDHELRLDFLQGEGEAGCILSWSFAAHGKEIVPASVLFHRTSAASKTANADVEPGLKAEFHEVSPGLEAFPDLMASEFDAQLARAWPRTKNCRSMSACKPPAPRPAACRWSSPSCSSSCWPVSPPISRPSCGSTRPTRSANRCSTRELEALCGAVATGGVLEVPRLLHAFEQSGDANVGRALAAALGRSPGLKALRAEQLDAAFNAYPAEVREQAAVLGKQLAVDTTSQKARLVELQDVLAGGEIQRGRDLFFGNKKAICATCHAVQGQGGRIGPDLSKIGAIRSPRDLLEAIVFPSASFARGYEPYNILTDDGQVRSGTISRETADGIYLYNTARVETRVPRSSIESITESPTSIMPTGMDAQLTRTELADLIAFLQSLR